MLVPLHSLVCLLALSVLAPTAGAQEVPGPKPEQNAPPAVEDPAQPVEAFWPLTPAAAFVEAAKQQKLSILIFLNPGEPASDQMQSGPLQDERVLKWLRDNAIAVKQVAGVDKGWIERKGIHLFPTVSIRTASRRIVDVIHGHHTTEEWLVLLDTALRSSTVHTKPEGAAKDDPYSWLAYGSYLFGSAGDPDEVGHAFLWCWDHGNKTEPDFLETHLEFLIRKLVQIGKISPNVKQGIYQRRDALHNRVVSGAATLFEAYALSRLGLYLRDMDDAIRAFQQIQPDSDHKRTLKSVLMWSNLERMVAYRRYGDILKHLPNPLHVMEARMEAIRILDKGVETLPSPDLPRPPGTQPPPESERLQRIRPETPLPGILQTRPGLIMDAALFYECLLATGRLEDAQALMVKVTDFEATGPAYALFIERANRLQLRDVIDSLAERGYERVPEDQIQIIRSMVIRGNHGNRSAPK